MTRPTDFHTACQSAADLFAEAGRRLDLPSVTRLECLAAEQSLQLAGQVLDPHTARLSSEDLIHTALNTLGHLPREQFRDERVRTAARHGRQALRGQATWPAR